MLTATCSADFWEDIRATTDSTTATTDSTTATTGGIVALGEEDGFDQVVGLMKKGAGIQSEILTQIVDTVRMVDQISTDAENRLIGLTRDIGIINTERIDLTKEAVTTYVRAKSSLRVARNELKRLADKTILSTDDLLLFMESWNNGYDVKDQ